MDITVWELWLPIIVSGVALFFASAAAWMLLPHHKPEWGGLPNEEAVARALRDANVPPGQYMFPYCAGSADMKSEDFQRRSKAGPHGTLSVWPSAPNMGLNMARTVVFFIIANFVIAYLASLAAIPRDAEFMRVFQFVGTAGILTYGTANILNGIWFNRKMMSDIMDGIAYGLITGLIFAAMWPGAST
ncbi:MAG: hypothetical protein WD669_13655 [Pirellulales bacterium]